MNAARWAMGAMILVAATGCRELAVPPAGSYSEVLLVTEDGAADTWTRALVPLITRETDYVLTQESGFTVTPLRASRLEDFPTYKNVVICGPLDASTEVGRRIRALIGEGGAEGVYAGRANILKKEDLPAPGQVTVVVTAPDDDALRRVIEERGEELPDVLEASCRERLRDHLLSRRNTHLSTTLYRKYGFKLDIPYLYVLLSEDSRTPGVELIREPPARVLGVYWVDRKEAPSIYDQDELFDIRSKYVWRRYDHDKMDRDKIRYTWTRLGPYDSIRMSGYWYNDDALAGGYFETYYIYDDSAKLLWAVDLVVFAPGHAKHAYVRELLAIAETFRYDSS